MLDWSSSIRLDELFTRMLSRDPLDGWLYLPRDCDTWAADTLAYMHDADETDEEADETFADAEDRGYTTIVDGQTLVGILEGARDQFNSTAFDVHAEALAYYFKFDAFLPERGAADPPSNDDWQREVDREFYDSLGPERADTPCRRAGCDRGAMVNSALCRVHHFEQVHDRPCPFDD